MNASTDWVTAGMRLLLRRGIYEGMKRDRAGMVLEALSFDSLMEIGKTLYKTEVEKEIAHWRRTAEVKKYAAFQSGDEREGATADLMEEQGQRLLDILNK